MYNQRRLSELSALELVLALGSLVSSPQLLTTCCWIPTQEEKGFSCATSHFFEEKGSLMEFRRKCLAFTKWPLEYSKALVAQELLASRPQIRVTPVLHNLSTFGAADPSSCSWSYWIDAVVTFHETSFTNCFSLYFVFVVVSLLFLEREKKWKKSVLGRRSMSAHTSDSNAISDDSKFSLRGKRENDEIDFGPCRCWRSVRGLWIFLIANLFRTLQLFIANATVSLAI